jgi:predicted dehydrogenase
MTPLRVGLVGAGPWAALVHAPMIAGHPSTALAGVWARRHAAAEALATANGSVAVDRFDDLLARCDAVAFCVPPDVQAGLAVVAARAGKSVLLEKPIALDLASAQRLADAVGEAGVGSQVLLTWRYTGAVRAFLADATAAEPIGGRGHFLSAAFLGGPFATPWRLEHGPLLDLGPHVIDTLDAALGDIEGVQAHGDPGRWVGLLLEHRSGAVSEVSLSGSVAVEPLRAGVEVYTRGGAIVVDAGTAVGGSTFTTVVDEFVETARGAPHALDVHRGLHLQRVLDAAGRQRS